MKQDQEQKYHVCRFCKQGFSNGKKLGGHMRRHLALIAACRTQEIINGEKGIHVYNNNDDTGTKQSNQEDDQYNNNGEKSLVFDDGKVKKSQQEHESGTNACVLRINPIRSWRVLNSSKDYDPSRTESMKDALFEKQSIQEINSRLVNKSQQDYDPSRTELMKNSSVCKKCGKGFDSMRALYGHMRCHSIKRSRPVDGPALLASSEDVVDDDDGVASLVRNKRSCTRYKSVKHSHVFTGLSYVDDIGDGDEVKGAICLMMLSRGMRGLDGVKMVNSSEDGVEVKMQSCTLKNKDKVGLKRDLVFESGSGRMDPGRSRSSMGKCKSTKKHESSHQDLKTEMLQTRDIFLELKKMKLA